MSAELRRQLWLNMAKACEDAASECTEDYIFERETPSEKSAHAIYRQIAMDSYPNRVIIQCSAVTPLFK
ncbi:MAG: hypothetical protein QM571_02895 [Micrococcaceae bacterium]